MSSYAFHVRAWLNEAQHPCEFRWCSTLGCSLVQVLSLTYTLLQTVVNSDWIKVWEGAQSPFGGPLGHLSGLLADSRGLAEPLWVLLAAMQVASGELAGPWCRWVATFSDRPAHLRHLEHL